MKWSKFLRRQTAAMSFHATHSSSSNGSSGVKAAFHAVDESAASSSGGSAAMSRFLVSYDALKSVVKCARQHDDIPRAVADFTRTLRREVTDADDLYRAELLRLSARLDQFEKRCEEILHQSTTRASTTRRLRHTAQTLERELSSLRLFAEFNCESVRKACKKFDKYLLRVERANADTTNSASAAAASPTVHIPWSLGLSSSSSSPAAASAPSAQNRRCQQALSAASFSCSDNLLELIARVGSLRARIDADSMRIHEKAEQQESSSIRRFLLCTAVLSSLFHFMVPELSFSLVGAAMHTFVVYVMYHLNMRRVHVRQLFEATAVLARFAFHRHVRRQHPTVIPAPLHPTEVHITTFFSYLPLNFLSKAWGALHKVRLPKWVRKPLYTVWCTVLGTDIDECRYPLETYANLGEFFCRPLKDGVRPIGEAALVSPVDSRVVSCGEVQGDRLDQIKGLSYSLSEFLGLHNKQDEDDDELEDEPARADSPTMSDESAAECDAHRDTATRLLGARALAEGKKLFQIVLYLAPGDYHRIHSPSDWLIENRVHFPGALLPVNPPFVGLVPNVFSVNERVALTGRWDQGFFSLTAVGAYNVGSIVLSFDKEVETNKSWLQPGKKVMNPYGPGTSYERSFPTGISVEKGEDIAHFRLGSTVVLVFAADASTEFAVKVGDKVRMGQPLLC